MATGNFDFPTLFTIITSRHYTPSSPMAKSKSPGRAEESPTHSPPRSPARGRKMSDLSDDSTIEGHDNDQTVREWDGVSDWDVHQSDDVRRRRASTGTPRLDGSEVYNANTGRSERMLNVSFSDLAGIDHPHSRRVQKMKSRALDEGFTDGEAQSPNASGAWGSNAALPGSPANAMGGYTPRSSRRLSLHEQKYTYTPTGKLLRARANTLILRYSQRVSFYAPPKARASWGVHQHESHINWGDNFFDLVYVGIAYKLGNMLKNSIREGYFLTGLLYFFAIYMNAYNCWERKMVYDARFETTSIFHKFVDLLQFCGVAIAALHIVGQQDQSVVNFWYPEDCGMESGQYEFGLCCGFFFDQVSYLTLYQLGFG